jgi:hypothetical protein
VQGEWRSLLGGEHELVARFLLPTRRVARSMRCTRPGRKCVHEIRKWKGEYLSVCPDGCETATLTRDEVAIHRLDVAALGREIATSFGLEHVPAEAMPDLAGVWRIGDYFPLSGYRFHVYLTFAGEPDHLRRAVDGLAARGRPFVLVAPTRSAHTHLLADVLTRAKACFLPLDELVGQSDGDGLALLDGHSVASIFAEFRETHVPEPKDDDGMVIFQTPAGVRWSDVSIRFADRHSVYVNVNGVSGVYHFAQMGMANKKNAKPTVQWDLLETFAEGHGVLDWSSRKADRKNQKRRENLADNLQRFFRIDDDPFVVEGNGWRAKFAVSVRE